MENSIIGLIVVVFGYALSILIKISLWYWLGVPVILILLAFIIFWNYKNNIDSE